MSVSSYTASLSLKSKNLGNAIIDQGRGLLRRRADSIVYTQELTAPYILGKTASSIYEAGRVNVYCF